MRKHLSLILSLILVAIAGFVCWKCYALWSANQRFQRRAQETMWYYSALIDDDVRPLSGLTLPTIEKERIAKVTEAMNTANHAPSLQEQIAALPDVQISLWALHQVKAPALLSNAHFTDLMKRNARPGEAYDKIKDFNQAAVILNAALDDPFNAQLNAFFGIERQKYLRIDGEPEEQQVIQL